MASTADRSRLRHERTFVGGECAICEEPLEHILAGEHILKFTCSHVSHEACFYEFIREFDPQSCPTCNTPLHLDTSRGGGVIDISKISKIVRTANTGNATGSHSTNNPTPTWDNPVAEAPGIGSSKPHHQLRQLGSNDRDSMPRSHVRDSRGATPSDHYEPLTRTRYDSETTRVVSSSEYPETTQSSLQDGTDRDAQCPETTSRSPEGIWRKPVPPPTVTIRSEFPAINTSQQQQILTCLVSVEVADMKWKSDPGRFGIHPHQPVPVHTQTDEVGARARSYGPASPGLYHDESAVALEEIAESLRHRVGNWQGMDFSSFGQLKLYGTLRVGKDKVLWQESECYLFAEILICTKLYQSPRASSHRNGNGAPRQSSRCALTGSILIAQHLSSVSVTRSIDENVLTMNLSVPELPHVHLRFANRNQLKLWNQALLDRIAIKERPIPISYYAQGDMCETDEDIGRGRIGGKRSRRHSASSTSSWPLKSATSLAGLTNLAAKRPPTLVSIHVPIDIVILVRISSHMQGVKINLVRDTLGFMINALGESDRLGVVTFGSGGGGVPIVEMASKTWPGWPNVLSSIKPVSQTSRRSDLIEGANVAVDLLLQRKHNNPIAAIILISNASTTDAHSVKSVISQAQAANITIHSFGLGTSHNPDNMIELSAGTKASYTYVKDWMMLRECLAGCLGGLQAISHQNVKLNLSLPEGSPAKFHKINGALQITKGATGRDAEANLGDLRFGDKRDILVQLIITPKNTAQEKLPLDPWDTIISKLEELGGPIDNDAERTGSVEEVPILRVDLSWRDILRDGAVSHLPRPSLLAITMLPPSAGHKSWQKSPQVPPHPSIVQRRMELLVSDMLTTALRLVSRGQHHRGHTLLSRTRLILNRLSQRGLLPFPPSATELRLTPPHAGHGNLPNNIGTAEGDRQSLQPPSESPPSGNGYLTPELGHSTSIDGLEFKVAFDPAIVAVLDAELESSLEWMNHPAVFDRDSRKAVLQAIGVISSQRAFTFRTPIESHWAGRVGRIKRLADKSRKWREDWEEEDGAMVEA